jgi:hypothetical protein
VQRSKHFAPLQAKGAHDRVPAKMQAPLPSHVDGGE